MNTIAKTRGTPYKRFDLGAFWFGGVLTRGVLVGGVRFGLEGLGLGAF